MQPHTLKSRIVARLAWLAIGVGFGGYMLSRSWTSHLREQVFLGAGFMLLGIVWFLQPPSVTAQVGRVDALSVASAIGPAWLRILLLLAAFGCLLFGVYLVAVGHGWLSAAAAA